MTIKEMQEKSHSQAVKSGFWDTPRNDGEAIALMHSELSECLEAMRSGGTIKQIAEELADLVIRVGDFCGGRSINLEEAIIEKMAYNETRPYRHDMKF